MLRFNELAIDLAETRCATSDALARAEEIAADTRQTRDMRFIDTTLWLVDVLQGNDVNTASTEASQARQRMSNLWSSGRVPLEVFLLAEIDGHAVKIPYVLSPHWRY